MSKPLKFTFDTAFGTRSEGDKLADNQPVITQADVDAARTQGFIQGREDGLNEIDSQAQIDFKNSMNQISSKLESLISAQAVSHQNAYENAQKFSILIAKKIAKAALNQYPTLQIQSLIEDCLSHISNLPHLVIRVNKDTSQLTKDELQPIIDHKGFDGKLIILGEEDIAVGDCMIEWADGGVAHNTKTIITRIDDILNDYFGIEVLNPIVESVTPIVEPEPVEALPARDEAKEDLNEVDEHKHDDMDDVEEIEEKMPMDDDKQAETSSLEDVNLPEQVKAVKHQEGTEDE